VVESDLLEAKANNWLAAVAGNARSWGLAVADISTGEFRGTSREGPTAAAELRDEIARLKPAEVLGAEDLLAGLGGGGFPLSPLDRVSPQEARLVLLQHFEAASLVPYGCEDRPALQSAAAGLLAYLKRTHQGGLGHLKSFTTWEAGSCMRLDPFTLEALEVVDPQRPDSPTLLGVLDATRSAMGGRTLRQWLVRPLNRAGDILNRLDAVGWLVDRSQERDAWRDQLGDCADLERIAARVGARSAGPKDLAGMRATLGLVARLRAAVEAAVPPGLLAEEAAALDPLPELAAHLSNALVDDPPFLVSEGEVIRGGFNPEVDELRKLAKHGKDVLLEIQARERAKTGIETLRIAYNSVFGYTIEIPRSKAHMAPDSYDRRQTLSNVERFVTPELKELEGRIMGAEERLGRLEAELFGKVRDRAAESLTALLATGRALGRADALLALADTAARLGYVRPAIDPAGSIEITEGRHPVLERSLPTFVSNDAKLVPWTEQIMLVTGPNMAGKSTYLRQVALLTLMAHAGSFVPAKEARIAVVDGIFCRIGSSDRLAKGMSTFMVEMTEVAHILNHATERSLLIFDEVGRGTSTYDGIAIAWAIVEHLARHAGAKTLFATHYYELTALAEEFPSVRNLNVLVREWRGELVFLYKIVPGRADRSYGVQVARLAGLPAALITRARELLGELESGGRAGRDAGGNQLPLFGQFPDPVRQRLEDVDPERLTPIEALGILQELKDHLRGGRPSGGGYSEA
jgi:DNA mismatch repair protein MutS